MSLPKHPSIPSDAHSTQILGVSKDADEEAIKKAYKKTALKQ